jgi:hypothetical protein
VFFDDWDQLGKSVGGIGSFKKVLKLVGRNLKKFRHYERQGDWFFGQFDGGHLHIRMFKGLLDQGLHELAGFVS